MSVKSLLVSGCLGGLFGSALVLALSYPPARPAPVEPSTPEPTRKTRQEAPPPVRRRPPPPDPSASIAALRSELEALRRTVAHLSAAPTDSQDAEPVSPPPEPSPEAQARRIEASFRALEDARYAEIRDEAWAHRTEAEAARSLAVEGSFVESFECASSLCELRARHDGHEDAEHFRDHLVMARVGDELGAVRWTNRGDETIAYFLRVGETWPPEEAEAVDAFEPAP